MSTTLSHEDVTTSEVVEVPQTRRARITLGVLFVVAGLAAASFGLFHGAADTARFRLSTAQDAVELPDVAVGITALGLGLGAVCLVLAGYQIARGFGRTARRWAVAVAVGCAVVSFLGWATTNGNGSTLNVPDLLRATVYLAVPLVLGALVGVVSERSGVINVAIEGHMLAGAFAGAVVGTVAGNLWVGVIGAVLVGIAVAALLAVFALRYQVNQVVLGVVINLLVLGLTNYLFSSLLQRDKEALNSPGFFRRVRIPVLADIPVIGPTLFDATALVYITVGVIVLVQIGLMRTRWGLRTRSVGEHPRAADTVGIEVNRLRFRNVLLAGAIAGLAGAAVSIGSVGDFNSNMTAGRGFIALAAVIVGRWTPLGAVGAAVLFAFLSSLQVVLGITGTPVDIPSQGLAMLPYLATIVIVAGAAGRVRPPAADGIPYVKG